MRKFQGRARGNRRRGAKRADVRVDQFARIDRRCAGVVLVNPDALLSLRDRQRTGAVLGQRQDAARAGAADVPDEAVVERIEVPIDGQRAVAAGSLARVHQLDNATTAAVADARHRLVEPEHPEVAVVAA